MITISEIVKELTQKGYKISPRTIKYYINQELLPKPEKKGQYKKGVRLIFKNYDEVMTRLIEIFDLKGRGYKLSEIKEVFRSKKIKKRMEYFDNFIEIDGNYYFVVDNEPDFSRYQYAECLGDFLEASYKEFKDADYANEVERRGLFVTPYIYQDRPVYDLNNTIFSTSWVELPRDYNIEWKTLEALMAKQDENLQKYCHWPNQVGNQFSKAWCGYLRRCALNSFGNDLVQQIKCIEGGYPDDYPAANLSEGYVEEYTIAYDYKYKNVDSFINDFFQGNCAFVPSHPFDDGDIFMFLKKF